MNSHLEGSAPSHVESVAPKNRQLSGQRSFLERFFDSFFQEKNIKWMLVVGAAIVFGSSLMLVTKAWPNWSSALRFLAVLGYTGAIFFAAEIGRKRLGLTATYKVLYSLTLLLLPVCFMALHWLSAGTARQTLDFVELCGLMLPATAFLWFASRRILDHILQGRQSTFLISYCLLCVAGVLPAMTSPIWAFAFTALCWLLFSAGVMKVNRHTFWLAEQHRVPRVFGFLPIAMLGLQFVVLVATKAITQLPAQWIGFGCVMVAATVLVTARTVADVFRQRTGDLVRPLPWNIVVPLFAGLVLTALGVALSFSGFSYGGESTYAVIPTAIVATALMWMAARDTRHAGFVWAGMICAAIAYQCSPTLFADIVQSMKDSTASAMNRQSVPLSLYGVTYLPLLGAFAMASRWFSNRGEHEFSKPLKDFVTAVAIGLFCVALTDVASLFFVSLANVAAFLVFAILFRDRRYVVASLAGVVIATGVAIPALNNMGYAAIDPIWIPTLLAGLAAAMTATRLPDRILNRIAIGDQSVTADCDPNADEPAQRHSLLRTIDGRDIGLSQLLGFVLAALVSAHWVGNAMFHFQEPVTDASLLQYAFLMAAFVLYTLRNPRYVSGLFFWAMLGFAAVRWAVGLSAAAMDVVAAASCITAGTSLLGYLWLKVSRQISRTTAFGDLRRGLGFDAEKLTMLPVDDSESDRWARRSQAFVVPLCDLSLVILSCLTAAVHLPLLLKTQFMIVEQSAAVAGSLRLSTIVAVLWLMAAAAIFRSRIAAIAATIALPLLATATVATYGIPLAASSLPMIWAIVAGTLFVVRPPISSSFEHSPVLSTIGKVSEGWLYVLLVISCCCFDMPLRVAGVICVGCLFLVDRQRLSQSQVGQVAVMANIHTLLFAGYVGGCTGAVSTVLAWNNMAAIPIVFLTLTISALVFDHLQNRLEKVLAQTWTALLRTGTIMLAFFSLADSPANEWVVVMVVGFVVAAFAEITQAVRRQKEMHVWSACAVGAMAAFYLFVQGVISFGAGISQFVLLGISIVGLTLAEFARRRQKLAIIRRPMRMIGLTLPTLVALMAVARAFSGYGNAGTAMNALALMTSAGIYFQQAMATRNRNFAIMAAVILNAGLMFLWRALDWTEPEFYLVPVGLSILALVELLNSELPKASHDPLRYIGALTILVSPMFAVMEGSWAHMLTLMVLSVVVILAAIGLRIRVLVYAGSAFLLTDLVAMVVHSTIANPVLLWVGGVALGVGVIALAAFCENHREKLLSQIRFVSAELATWH